MIYNIVTGNLGQDPVKRNKNGREFYTFSLASNEVYKDSNGEKVKETTWVSCIGNHPLTPHLKKGDCVTVTGKGKSRAFQSKKDHKWYATIELNVDHIDPHPTGKKEEASSEQ